jgi:NAD+ kinase
VSHLFLRKIAIAAKWTEGDHIKVTASKYPFPTVCADKASTDWFNSISRTLRWNEREKQKSFVVVEEENEPASSHKSKRGAGPMRDGAKKAADRTHEELKEEDEDALNGEGAADEEEDDDEEEEDEFDIDE